MTDYEQETGGDVLAIAHNGNLSNGVMFPVINPWANEKLNAEYVEQRAKWEPLYEVTQIKGDGEAHPFLSPNDEFADYETWDQGNLDLSVVKQDDMLQYEYARSALQIGLQLAPQGKSAPTFLVAALKDPLSGNLDRIQIIKGWVDSAGERQEKVYDVDTRTTNQEKPWQPAQGRRRASAQPPTCTAAGPR